MPAAGQSATKPRLTRAQRIVLHCDRLKEALLDLEDSCNPTDSETALKLARSHTTWIASYVGGWADFVDAVLS